MLPHRGTARQLPRAITAPSGEAGGSDLADVHELVEAHEIVGVAGVERHPVGMSDGGDKQVCESTSAGPTSSAHRGEDQSVGAGCGGIDWYGVIELLDLLKPQHAARSLGAVPCGMHSCGQLGEGYRADRR